MLFHTVNFAIFFVIVLPAFLLAPHRARWAILLFASLGFFGSLGVPALISALAVVTLASYVAGLAVDTTRPARTIWLWAGVTCNVLVLAAFKFLPAPWFGRGMGQGLLALVGVSYFTFQGISYVVDVYAGTQKPERHLGYFALYMAFFPKVLQGPIERAGDLLPQLRRRFEFDAEAWRAGAILFAWGLFKKTVVADRAGPVVEAIYGSVTSYQGLPLALGTYLFAVQLYCDFSGYTDMALGLARFFGIHLTQNFNNPYAASSIVEFWRRWHISFSRWIFDYLFNPLQFTLRDRRTAGTVIGLIDHFLRLGGVARCGLDIPGLGADARHLHVRLDRHAVISEAVARPNLAWASGWGRAWKVFATVHLCVLSWIFFRAESLGDALYVVTHVATGMAGTRALLFEVGLYNALVIAIGAAVVGWIDMLGAAIASRAFCCNPCGSAGRSITSWLRQSWYSVPMPARHSSTSSSNKRYNFRMTANTPFSLTRPYRGVPEISSPQIFHARPGLALTALRRFRRCGSTARVRSVAS